MTYSWTVTPWIGDLEGASHASDAVVDSLDQYGERPRFHAFLEALMDRVQSLEDLGQEELVMRSVYTAEGVQLDVLGEIVGLERGELADDEYRIFILGKIFANLSDGKSSEIAELLTDILDHDTVSVRELWPAGLEIYADGVDYPVVTNRLMKFMVAAGVYYGFVYSSTTDANTFKTAPTSAAETGLATNGPSYDAEGGTDGLIAGVKSRRWHA